MRDSIDEKLAAAMFDVPVPAGLAERVLARLKRGELVERDETASTARPARRVPAWFLVGGSVAAMAASLVAAIWLGMSPGGDLSEQYVLDEAIRSFEIGVEQPGPLAADTPAPADYPFSASVVPVRGTRWRSLDGSFLGGCRGVVYDLPGMAGGRAALFVLAADSIEAIGGRPALCPFTTAGCCASAWQESGLLYVLVVQGDAATYRAYLDLPHDPVARAFSPARVRRLRG